MEKRFNAMGFFTGCGGSSLGVKLAGYNEVLAIDFDQNSHECHLANFPATTSWNRMIIESPESGLTTTEQIREGFSSYFENDSMDLFQMSPPCQFFSMANVSSRDEEKIKPFYDSIAIIQNLRPKVAIIENVEGVVAQSRSREWYRIRQKLQQTGYAYDFRILDASDYGVPQSRKRLFIIAVRPDIAKLGLRPVFPKKMDIDKRLLAINNVLPSRPAFFSTGQFGNNLIPGSEICHTITKTPNIYLYGDAYSQSRFATTDELKILSSFPVSFIFPGDAVDAANRIGNCVPPLLMKAVADAVRIGILEPYYSRLANLAA